MTGVKEAETVELIRISHNITIKLVNSAVQSTIQVNVCTDLMHSALLTQAALTAEARPESVTGEKQHFPEQIIANDNDFVDSGMRRVSNKMQRTQR